MSLIERFKRAWTHYTGQCHKERLGYNCRGRNNFKECE